LSAFKGGHQVQGQTQQNDHNKWNAIFRIAHTRIFGHVVGDHFSEITRRIQLYGLFVFGAN
jgi:hypothetical protein